MLKTYVEWQVISLQSFEHFDIISVVCSVDNMENCDVCFSVYFQWDVYCFGKNTYLETEKNNFCHRGSSSVGLAFDHWASQKSLTYGEIINVFDCYCVSVALILNFLYEFNFPVGLLLLFLEQLYLIFPLVIKKSILSMGGNVCDLTL